MFAIGVTFLSYQNFKLSCHGWYNNRLFGMTLLSPHFQHENNHRVMDDIATICLVCHFCHPHLLFPGAGEIKCPNVKNSVENSGGFLYKYAWNLFVLLLITQLINKFFPKEKQHWKASAALFMDVSGGKCLNHGGCFKNCFLLRCFKMLLYRFQ